MRRLLKLLTALSLLLCVAATVLWVRGYWVTDTLGWRWAPDGTSSGAWLRRGPRSVFVFAGNSVVIQSNSGVLWIGYTLREPSEWTGPFHVTGPPYPPAPTPGWRTFATEAHTLTQLEQRALLIPHWIGLLAFSVPPALGLFRARARRRRDRAGLCPRCGYDLRATPDRCPECGQVQGTREKA